MWRERIIEGERERESSRGRVAEGEREMFERVVEGEREVYGRVYGRVWWKGERGVWETVEERGVWPTVSQNLLQERLFEEAPREVGQIGIEPLLEGARETG